MTFTVRLFAAASIMLGSWSSVGAQTTALPAPILKLDRAELFANANSEFARWQFVITNKAKYPRELFAPAPDLPPCGRNANSSRTWVDFFAADGTRLYGFCALASPDVLDNLWFATPMDQVPPDKVYVEFTDRRTDSKVRSNLVDLTPDALMAAAQVKQAQGDNRRAFRLMERAISYAQKSSKVQEAWYQAAVKAASSVVPN